MSTAAAAELVVVRCQLGGREAIGELVERWRHPLWSFVHRLLSDPTCSNDLAATIVHVGVRGGVPPGLTAGGVTTAFVTTATVLHLGARRGRDALLARRRGLTGET